MPDRTALKQILAAIAALCIGVAVYLFHRTGGAYFLPEALEAPNLWPPLFHRLGYNLPSFTHTYAFTLLTAACLPFRRTFRQVACTAWFLIESLFEVAQHPIVADAVAVRLPLWMDGVPFLEAAGDYFRLGRFDPLDTVAIAFGTGLAWLTIIISSKRSSHENTA